MLSKTGTVDTGDMARVLVLSMRHVKRLVQEGVLVRAKDVDGHELRGRFDWRENVQNYIRYIRDQRGLDDPGETRYTNFRNRRMEADAKMAELRYGVQKGELLTKTTVEIAMTEMITRCKSRLLAMPARISRLLIGQKNFRKIYGIIRTDLDQCLAELRFDFNKRAKGNRNGADEENE